MAKSNSKVPQKQFTIASVRSVVGSVTDSIYDAVKKFNPKADVDVIEAAVRELVTTHATGKPVKVIDKTAHTSSADLSYSLTADLLVMAAEAAKNDSWQEAFRLFASALDADDASILFASLSEMNESTDIGIAAEAEEGEADSSDSSFYKQGNREVTEGPETEEDEEDGDGDPEGEEHEFSEGDPGEFGDGDDDLADDDEDMVVAAELVAAEMEGEQNDEEDDNLGEMEGDEEHTSPDDSDEEGGEDNDDDEDAYSSDEVMASDDFDSTTLDDGSEDDEADDGSDEADPEEDEDNPSVPMGDTCSRKAARKAEKPSPAAEAKLRALANKLSISGNPTDRNKAASVIKRLKSKK